MNPVLIQFSLSMTNEVNIHNSEYNEFNEVVTDALEKLMDEDYDFQRFVKE